MASLAQWTWVWVDSRCWWWTGRPDILQFMGSQWVGQDWATELNWTELNMQRCIWHKNPLLPQGVANLVWKIYTWDRNHILSQGHTIVLINPLEICVVAYEFQCSGSIMLLFWYDKVISYASYAKKCIYLNRLIKHFIWSLQLKKKRFKREKYRFRYLFLKYIYIISLPVETVIWKLLKHFSKNHWKSTHRFGEFLI